MEFVKESLKLHQLLKFLDCCLLQYVLAMQNCFKMKLLQNYSDQTSNTSSNFFIFSFKLKNRFKLLPKCTLKIPFHFQFCSISFSFQVVLSVWMIWKFFWKCTQLKSIFFFHSAAIFSHRTLFLFRGVFCSMEYIIWNTRKCSNTEYI